MNTKFVPDRDDLVFDDWAAAERMRMIHGERAVDDLVRWETKTICSGVLAGLAVLGIGILLRVW